MDIPKPEEVIPLADLPVTFFAYLNKDFKAEVRAAEIAELGVLPVNIILAPSGAMKRSLAKDIISIEEEATGDDQKHYIVVKTSRDGIYDMLPEGLFHATDSNLANTSTEVVKAIRQRKLEEDNARKFFRPFEAAINQLRIEMALCENRFDKRMYYDDLAAVFSNYWEIFQYMDSRQTNIMLHLVPIIHDIRDNHAAVETILNEIFQCAIQIILRPRLPVRNETPIFSMLGDSSLGVNFTTGNEWYDEGLDEILVTIGPIANEVYQDFREGGNRHKILELLSDYLLPVHIDVVTEFELLYRDQIMRLAKGDNYLNSVLGSDTYL